jgi:hypothetical protein
LRDLGRSAFVLLNLEPMTIPVIVDEVSVDIEAPITGTVIEVWEAWKAGIPVVGYNADSRGAQTRSLWFDPFLTAVFSLVEEALAYGQEHWLR